MTESQAQRGIDSLYEEATVRDELTDDEAKVLLEWGEALVRQLAARDLPDEQFDEALLHLHKLLTRANRFTSRRLDMSPEEQQEMLDKIIDSTQQATGVRVAAAQMADFTTQQAALDNIANLRALATLLTPAFISSVGAAPTLPAPTDNPAEPPLFPLLPDGEDPND